MPMGSVIRRAELWGPFVLAIVAHAGAIVGGFVLDDADLLTRNPYVRTLVGLRELVSRELFMACGTPRHLPYWRPLSGALYWATWQLFGDVAPLQHALQLVMLAGVAALLAAALRALGSTASGAFVGGAIVAVHPLGSELAAYVGGRQPLLAWLFILGALAALPSIRSVPGRAIACGVASFLAICAHESGVAAVVILPLACGLPAESRSRRGHVILLCIGASAAGVALNAALRAALQIMPASLPPNVSAMVWARTSAGVISRVAHDVVWPTDIALDVTIDTSSVVPMLALCTLLLAVAMACFYSRPLNHSRVTLVRIAIFCVLFAALLPLPLAAQSGYIADRHAFGALVGLAFIVGAFIANVRGPKLLPAFLVGLLICGFAVHAAWARDAAWHDETTLYEASYAARPTDPQSILGLAYARIAADDIDGAYPFCVAYVNAVPGSDRADFCLGAYLFEHGQPGPAEEHFGRYATTHANMESARRGLLAVLFALGKLAEARTRIEAWEAQFPGAPDLAEARDVLAKREKH